MERTFSVDFLALTQAAQRLFVRLISRKGPLFRTDRLQYPEIPDLDTTCRELETAGFLDRARELEPAEILPLLLRAELLELGSSLGLALPSAGKKHQLLEAIREVGQELDLRAAIDRCVTVLRPLRTDTILTFRLLFFGNLRQDWTEFVLRDLGVVRYETYSLERHLRRFPTRRAFDEQLTLRRSREEVIQLLSMGELDTAARHSAALLDPRRSWLDTSRSLVDSILLRVARALERSGRFDEALDLYREARRPPARERRGRILARLERFDEALALCQEILAAPVDDTEAEFGPRFAHQVRRKRGEQLAPWNRPRRPTLELDIPNRPGKMVESLVLEALTHDGRKGFFSENWLWKSLVGLAFWDILFAPVPGAFHHPFQLGPADFHGPEFRQARAPAIEARLRELEAEENLAERLLPVYRAHHNKANYLVAWNEELLPYLELAMCTVTGQELATIADRMSRDPRRFRRGLPDLFLTRADGKGFELLEVKAPGDQLRPEQGAWIDFLNARGIRSRVVRVRWTPAPLVRSCNAAG